MKLTAFAVLVRVAITATGQQIDNVAVYDKQ